jgi:hypothetical protein
VFRALEGILDYTSICLSFRLHYLFNRVIQSFAMRITANLEKSRSSSAYSPYGKLTQGAYSLTLRKLEADKCRKHNLRGLLGTDVPVMFTKQEPGRLDDSFVSEVVSFAVKNGTSTTAAVKIYNDNNGGAECGIGPEGVTVTARESQELNWTGAALVRGELMAKVLFYMLTKYLNLVEKDSWLAVLQLLLWIRNRGCLPDNLARLDDAWFEGHPSVPSITLKSRDDMAAKPISSRAPSLYACRCHGVAQGLSAAQLAELTESKYGGQAGESSLWSSVKGLLWSQTSSSGAMSDCTTPSSYACSSLFQLPLNSNSCLRYRHRLESRTVAGADFKASRDMSADDFLQLALISCPAGELFELLKVVDDKKFVDAAVALVDVIDNKLKYLLDPQLHRSQSGTDLAAIVNNGKLSQGPDDTGAVRYGDIVNTELDIVAMLEWLSCVVFENQSRLVNIWVYLQGECSRY